MCCKSSMGPRGTCTSRRPRPSATSSAATSCTTASTFTSLSPAALICTPSRAPRAPPRARPPCRRTRRATGRWAQARRTAYVSIVGGAAARTPSSCWGLRLCGRSLRRGSLRLRSRRLHTTL
eukprot:Amastigsp_a844722_27.p2 type:complete len:122 gc:universal Amastigsp_a844722_27:753-388(-)